MSAVIDIDDVRTRVSDLPKLPSTVHEIFEALQDEELSVEAFARTISLDPALVARILRAANSPFYGMPGKIGSLQDAVRLVGLRTVGTLVTTVAVQRTIQPPRCEGFDFQEFWRHSLATAVCGQELASRCAVSPALAFTAGLVHDIGRLALASYFPHELALSLRHARENDLFVLEAERLVLGVDHAQVGGWIAAHWRFADVVSQAIADHHAPAGPTSDDASALTDIVHAADGIVHALDLAQDVDDMVPPMRLDSWERLRIAPESFPRIFRRSEEAFAAMRDSLL